MKVLTKVIENWWVYKESVYVRRKGRKFVAGKRK
jgi:hypothetical protein